MKKPSYEELESQILAQKTTIDYLNGKTKEYNALVNSTPKMFKIIELIFDKNGKGTDFYYREVNPAFQKLVGKTKTQLIDKRFKELFEITDTLWIDTYNEVMKTGTLRISKVF